MGEISYYDDPSVMNCFVVAVLDYRFVSEISGIVKTNLVMI